MDRDWTVSFSIRFRNGTCIIILDKKYNIANSSWHWGSYGSIWTGPSTNKYYMDRSFWGPYNIFCYIYLFFSLGFDIHVLWIVIIPLSNKNGNGILKLSFFKYNVVENFIYFFTLDSTNKWCWYMYCFFLITQPCLALPPICACPLYIFISQWYRGTWFPTSYV